MTYSKAYPLKLSLLAALGAAGLLLAGCSSDQDQDAETTADAPAAAAHDPAVTLVPTTASPIPTVYADAADTLAFRTDARHLAGRVATDLKLTDHATRRRLESTYFTRRRRLARLNARYAADTAGRYAALRGLNDETDRSVRRLLPTPVLVRTYDQGRAGYYEGPFTAGAAEAEVNAAAAPVAPAALARPRRRGPRIVKYKKRGQEVKIKYSDGTIVKIDKDGDRSIRYGNGRKVKVEAHNGRRKKKK